jgi:tripartite-type tricarboxylate transporter receptor subunit TctC
MLRPRSRKILTGILLLGLLILSARAVHAEEYPAKPVTLIIPFGPGGGHDLLFRALTSVSSDYLGQPVIIKLMPGGGGAIGADIAVKAPPDGYTLFAGGNTPSTALPAIEGRSKGPDHWEAVCRINYNPTIIVARPDAPYKTFKQMIDWAKANPGKLTAGTPGPWSPPDVVWKHLMKETGITMKIVPFDGGGPLIMALLGGHIDVGSALPVIYAPYKNSAKINPLLLLEEKRYPDLPSVPTSTELGVDGGINILGRSWRGVMAPKGTPRPIVDKLAAGFKKMTEDKSVISMIQKYGDEIHFLGPEEFSKSWRAEFEIYRELGKAFKK